MEYVFEPTYFSRETDDPISLYISSSSPRVVITPDGIEAVMRLGQGDMRRVLNLLQSTHMAYQKARAPTSPRRGRETASPTFCKGRRKRNRWKHIASFLAITGAWPGALESEALGFLLWRVEAPTRSLEVHPYLGSERS